MKNQDNFDKIARVFGLLILIPLSLFFTIMGIWVIPKYEWANIWALIFVEYLITVLVIMSILFLIWIFKE